MDVYLNLSIHKLLKHVFFLLYLQVIISSNPYITLQEIKLLQLFLKINYLYIIRLALIHLDLFLDIQETFIPQYVN